MRRDKIGKTTRSMKAFVKNAAKKACHSCGRLDNSIRSKHSLRWCGTCAASVRPQFQFETKARKHFGLGACPLRNISGMFTLRTRCTNGICTLVYMPQIEVVVRQWQRVSRRHRKNCDRLYEMNTDSMREERANAIPQRLMEGVYRP